MQNKHKRKICYWNPEKRVLGTSTVTLEAYLKLLGDIEIVEVDGLDSEEIVPCDLLIVSAEYICSEEFPHWLRKFVDKVQNTPKVWTPAIIFSDISFPALGGILHEVAQTNWYFDILSIRHITSLPIRVANLFRIHDHLKELHRYNEEITALSQKINSLEQELQSL